VIQSGRHPGQGCLMLLDGGSKVCIMSYSILERCGLECEPCNPSIRIRGLQSRSDNAVQDIKPLGMAKDVDWVFVDTRTIWTGSKWLVTSTPTTRTDCFFVVDTEDYDLALSSDRIEKYDFYRPTSNLPSTKVFRDLQIG
jgi:hypothetical protein